MRQKRVSEKFMTLNFRIYGRATLSSGIIQVIHAPAIYPNFLLSFLECGRVLREDLELQKFGCYTTEVYECWCDAWRPLSARPAFHPITSIM